MTQFDQTHGFETLLGCLADEETALRSLLLRLKEQGLLLTSGEIHSLGQTSADVALALEGLAAATSRREAAAAPLHESLELGLDSTLAIVADRAPDEAVGQRIRQRRRSLRDALDQVRRSSRHNRDLLAGGLAATGDALALLGVTPTYNAVGTPHRHAIRRPSVLDARA
jgi:flagellar biosynthesis/type III secretory pathway chaperone